MKNLYIVADGLGGAGKDTVLKNLREYFLEKGYRVVMTFEPGGTPEADRLRAELFERKKNGAITFAEELDYVFAARAMRRRYGAGFDGDGFDMQSREYWQSVAMGYYNEATDIARSQGLFWRETKIVDAKHPVEVVCGEARRIVEEFCFELPEGRVKGWYK